MNQFGPLTFGTLLGGSIGLVVAACGVFAIYNGEVQRSYESILLVAFGAAILGGGLGIFAEYLILHPAVAARPWMRHVLRPIMFCTVPYVILAMSLSYYGYHKLMGGFVWFFVVLVFPSIGIAIVLRRRSDPAFDQRFADSPVEGE